MRYFIIGLLIPWASVSAHHSAVVQYDRNDIAEIAGVLTDVKWQNPHVVFTVVVSGEDGREVEWLVEEAAPLFQERRGVRREHYRVGARIRVAGYRGRRNRESIFATNTLLADGRELMSASSAGPRWSDSLVGPTYEASVTENTSANDIFRVWSWGLENANRPLWKESYPLTAEARATQAAWDPVTDDAYLRCQHGMPAIMDSPHPLELVRDGVNILIRMEEQDVVRTVYMGSVPAERHPSPFGRSVGRWERDTLVVVTTDIDWPWFDQDGIPQSDAMRLDERFSVSADGRYLNYSITATDPSVFTEPVTMERQWLWVPGQQIGRYDCVWEGNQPSAATSQ